MIENKLKQIRSLHNGQIVRYKFSHNGKWSEWFIGALYVQKREVDLPKKYRKNIIGDSWKAGSVLIVTPKNHCTAEFGENDYIEEFDEFNCEEYNFKIDWSYVV